jgi:hypothetical protein
MNYYGFEIQEATGHAAHVWEYQLVWDGVVQNYATNVDELKIQVLEIRVAALERELKDYEDSALIREFTAFHEMGFNQIGEG